MSNDDVQARLTRLMQKFHGLHKARHEHLHAMLDELMGDYFIHNKTKTPSNTTLAELMEWSHGQTQAPEDVERGFTAEEIDQIAKGQSV